MAKIVVVEDEKDLREMIAEELVEEGHEVMTASDGSQGIEQIRRFRPDIVLADINMPHMNGFEMRKALMQRNPELAKKPFIFVSALSENSNIAEGLHLGADHYVTKPIDFDSLHIWVKNLV